MGEDFGFLPLDQWQREQTATEPSARADVLEVDRLYEIDGGVFQAQRTEDGRWELWTWMGKAGHAVARTGFEIDAAGNVYDRLFDTAAGEMLVLVPPRFTVTELQPIPSKLHQIMQTEVERLWTKLLNHGSCR